MIRVVLHLHTRFSDDAKINPKFVVDSLYAHPKLRNLLFESKKKEHLLSMFKCMKTLIKRNNNYVLTKVKL
jgi:hypothetical protein